MNSVRKFTHLRTGGILNYINETYGINKPHRTVPIMKLLSTHRPKSETAVVKLLESHENNRCALCHCQVHNGGLSGWTDDLIKAVGREGHTNITENECSNFIYDLFVRGPLRGQQMEDQALNDLILHYKDYGIPVQFRTATEQEDILYAVDIVMEVHNKIKAGVQVKSTLFESKTRAVEINKNKNNKWVAPVVYLVYDHKGRWINFLPTLQDLNGYAK
jgi:hypothetical protein